MNNNSLDSRKPKRDASAKDKQLAAIEPPRRKPFPKQVQKGEVTAVEMTRSCARDLTDRIKTAVNDAAEMLHRAHEGRAWVPLGYASWKEYCAAEFQLKERRSYQLLDFVEIKRSFEDCTIVQSPQNESQTRPLKLVPAEKRVEVWERANEMAGSEALTAKHVEQAVVELPQPEKQQPEISDELRDEIRDTIAAALQHAWVKLTRNPEMEWQLFRSGVRGWLQTK